MKRTESSVRRGIGLAILLLALALCYGAPVMAGTPYADPQGRFALVIPDGYDQQAPDATSTALLASNVVAVYTSEMYPDAGMLVSILPNDPRVHPPVAVALAAIHDIAARSSAHLIGAGSDMVQGTTLAEMPAVRVEYGYEANGIGMRVAQLAVQNGPTLFVLTVTARATDFAAFYEDAKVMIDGFTVQA